MWLERRRAALRTIVGGAHNDGTFDALGELYSERLIYRRPPLADIEGLDGLREYIADLRCAFSDIEFIMDRIISEGEAHAALWTLRATHTGQSPAMPVPPRGRRVIVSGSTLGVWAGMKIVEEWSHMDWLGLFRQLGVIPPMGRLRVVACCPTAAARHRGTGKGVRLCEMRTGFGLGCGNLLTNQ